MNNQSNDQVIRASTKPPKTSDVSFRLSETQRAIKAMTETMLAGQRAWSDVIKQTNIAATVRSMQAITEAYQPFIEHQKIIAESIRLAIPDFKALFGSYATLNFDTSLQTQLKEINKVAAQLSFKSVASVAHDLNGVKWQQNTDLDIRLELVDLKQGQEKILAKLDRKPTLDEAIQTLEEMGMTAVSFVIQSAKLIKSELTINNHDVIKFEPDTIQSRFIGLFFANDDKLKKRAYTIDEIIDKLDEDYFTLSKERKRALKKRYQDTRIKVNDKIKIATAIKADFIMFSENKFSINQELLKA